jgi:choline kinase
MTGVILAAGIGSRLGAPMPKGLMKLPNDETILGRQVRILTETGVDRIVMVVGHKREMIQDLISGVRFIYNPRYGETNTAKSLLCAAEQLNDDILWLNGDVVFDRAVIARMARQAQNTILVDSAECGEEEVKYIADESGSIREISKAVKDAQGEALGINLVTREYLKQFVEALRECTDHDYFERALQAVIDVGVIFKKLDVLGLRCIEIDFVEDWDEATKMFDGSE